MLPLLSYCLITRSNKRTENLAPGNSWGSLIVFKGKRGAIDPSNDAAASLPIAYATSLWGSLPLKAIIKKTQN
jgi:hypothetical protein